MNKTLSTALTILVLVSVAAAAPNATKPASEDQAKFDALLKQIQTDPGSAKEAHVREMLSLAKSLGKCQAASLVVRGYLSHHFEPSPELMRATGEAAYLAGDYVFAAARLKSYLLSAKPSPQAAGAAALLYTTLIDNLEAGEDAYQFIAKYGTGFRKYAPARRFDGWFLEQARRRGDVVGAARMLESVVSNPLPAAQEKMYYGQYLDWLTESIARPNPKHYEALSSCQKIAKGLRADAATKTRVALYTANLAYRAGSAGKDDAAMARDLTPVIQAGEAYFAAAPTAETLRQVCGVLAGGWFDHRGWDQAREPKQAFFARCLDKLSDAEKIKVIEGRWQLSRLASAEQWAAFAEANARLLATTPMAGDVPMPTDSVKTMQEVRKYAGMLAKSNSYQAVVMRGLATGGSLTDALDAMVKNDAWHFGYDYYGLVDRTIRIWRNLHANDGNMTSGEYINKAWIHFGQKHLCNTPIAIHDRNAVINYLRAAWHSSSADPLDKSKFPAHLEKIYWSPIGMASQRRQDRINLTNEINEWAKQWADELRKQSREAKPPAGIKEKLAQITPVMDAIKRFRDSASSAKAPNAMCKAMADWYLTGVGGGKNRQGADRAVYDLVRRYAQDKTPFGRQAMVWLTEWNRKNVSWDLQLHMLADQLADYSPSDTSGDLDVVEALLRQMQQRADRRSGYVHSKNKAEALKVAEILAKAIVRLADKGEFSDTLFNYLRGYRRGRNWTGGKIGQDALIKVMEKNLFEKYGYRPDHNRCRSATVSYMYLIRNEFAELAKQYPLDKAFDDMFVEEARRSKYLDYAYYEYAQDSEGKIARVAAQLLSADEVPIGEDREGTYTLYTLSRWLTTAFRNDATLRNAVMDKIEGKYGKTRFDPHAMGLGRFTDGTDPQPAERGKLFAALGTYIDRAAEAPFRANLPTITGVANIEPKSLTQQEADVLLKMFTRVGPRHWSRGYGHDKALEVLLGSLKANRRWADMLSMAGPAWKVCRDIRDWNFVRNIANVADDMRKAKNQDVALAFSSAGLTTMQRDLPQELRWALTGVRTWAMGEMGGMIPVPRGHALYRLYEAQLAYLGGRHQSAWEAYSANRDKLMKSFREFDPMFCAWVIEKETEFKNYDTAEALAREIMAWFDQVADQIEPEARAQIQLSYAHIAADRGDRPRARALYQRIVTNKDFAGTRSQMNAELAIADVDTKAGNYDQAIERLIGLSQRKSPYLQTESAYHMALVKYAQEEYAEASDQLNKVFSTNPDHADGRILEGRVNLKLKKLEQPTDIDLGERIGKKYIIPGQPVRVSLTDQNLSVVRKAMAIEIRAWSDSGDEELFTLAPFGDSKTKFKGRMATALGAPVKNDKVLQVLGKDKVHYAFSEAFAAAQKIEFNTPFTLQVISDAELYASSGAILNREQREALALEEMIRKRMGADEDVDPAEQAALSTVRKFDQIMPGNKINVRVVDPDRGVSPGLDKVVVRVAAASGDAIGDFELTETGEYTGVFEAAVPTEPAQATATASDSLEGSEANFTIAPKDYPAWVGLPKTTENKPKTLSVNLNDNVALGKMRIEAREQGRKLKDFKIQTSFNGEDFTTVGAWPEPFVPWTGQATATFVRFRNEVESDTRNLPASLIQFRKHLEQGHIRQGQTTVVSVPIENLSVALDSKLMGKGRELGLDTNKSARRFYVAHFKAAFYQERRMVRTFALRPRKTSSDETRPIHYAITLDGQEPKKGDNRNPLEIQRTLTKGVHVIEVFVSAEQNANPSFEVVCDIPTPPYAAPCPAEMFDLAKHPEIAAALAAKPAVVKASDANSVFDIQFPAGSRAKVVRLLIADFETDAPAVNRIALTDAAGKQVLPTKHDFMDLRRNDILELIPGDRVTVTYRDPSVLTLGKTQHEAMLTATHTDAALRACFVEHSLTPHGERVANYIGMRRFGPGDAINVFINDPDGDVSAEMDVLTFTARTSEGKEVELKALETEEHSGVFLGAVFPVAGDPNRPSELKVKPGDDVILSYLDKENIHPGIPWKREFSVEQVWYTDPQVRIFDVKSVTVQEADKLAGASGKAKAKPRAPARRIGGLQDVLLLNEFVPERRTLMAVRPEKADENRPANLIIGGPMLVEVTFPAIAKSDESECVIYVQSASGRAKAGLAPDAPFDPNVPGTLKLHRKPGDDKFQTPPPGYRDVAVHGNPYALPAIDEGRFTFSVPFRLGMVPEETLIRAEEEARQARTDIEKPVLAVNGRDEVYVGLHYTDAKGQKRWLVKRAVLSGDSFFDVMTRRYEEPVTGAYVGESLYLRVIDPVMDANDAKDVVRVELTTQSGQKRTIDLVETFSHSGVFKGLARIVHANDKAAAQEADTLPTIYGDLVTAEYASPKTGQASELSVEIFKGADGAVLPFTKRFKDPAVAVETQFLIAEAYFELAKRHRQLGEDSLARREIAQGRKLLEEAIADYPNTSARAQAEYLLADLALESGNDAVNPDLRKKYYMDAIARYGEIVASYGDSEYAPKAQYRKALAYEKMDMLDEACEEYVKLSYRYPDNPLVAETIARLGNYFLIRGQGKLAEAKKQTDLVKAEKIKMQAAEMFKTGGQVFARLGERFPRHNLAGKTLLLSAQCFMQAADYPAAIKGYESVIKKDGMDKDLVAEAYYWAGHTHMEHGDVLGAYKSFKKLTWDYPASKWAKYARGRLADEKFENIKD